MVDLGGLYSFPLLPSQETQIMYVLKQIIQRHFCTLQNATAYTLTRSTPYSHKKHPLLRIYASLFSKIYLSTLQSWDFNA